MSCSVELRQQRQQGMAEDPHKLAAIMNKSQRLVLGLLVLLLVDIIWVSSSELTKYIYQEAAFKKPFFSTYIKTSMFTLYLLGLCFWPPWRDQCNKPATYMFIDPNMEDDNFYAEANTSLSDPTFVPIKTPEHCDRSSGTESDDSSIRSVRFSKLAEVRHMSECDATEALLARLSYQASVRAGEHAKRQANKFSVQKVAKIALMFCLLWFMANYTYQISLIGTEAGIVTVLSSTSSLFTLFLAAVFPSNGSDKFTLSKFVAVLISILGLVLVSLSDLTIEANRIPIGIILALVSAFFYAAYLVFLRRKVDHEDKMDIPMFFGFVGLFNLTLLWPLFFILHYGDWEDFEWPNTHQWTFLIINGLIGTVLSEVLWLWGCFLTSSLIATLAVSLTMPMSMLADVLVKKVEYPCMFYLGTVPMLLAFVIVSLLSYYDNWDPVLEGVKRLYTWVCRRSRSSVRIQDLEAEQTESLICINNEDALQLVS
ncbi:solute carrier family 35 member F5 [Neodiprion pinetum]|uniref:Solute carrier family 35 member F5 n=1 Tax=Neodiprion lecontei TaxID=441921 RepID=A0A6J0B8F1_NEOLC|nr:solute carrier family 35 member F5 [Neodiprion lecontei]XP_015509919.2 solute carrier family 35 member F5 [Neodiprion lecontei]XP_046436424.1 solute carrier family 35 member F5 [Neodiprion fabricii]XP_046469705.1 solute carrier family 35 member F5 [Neodiprion pinetum]XP_046469715.1 solute carrier family 35 member F5 [Neodiprion pinetum]XP_046585945.1 solute carrier family 35 member F5 [Neodiprion lecontei]